MSIMTIMSKTSKEIKPYLSTGEVARICHMSRATVFNWVKDGKLKASRVPGGRYNIFRRDFLSFMKKSNLLALVEENSLYQETRILIVDDEELARSRLQRMLTTLGHDEIMPKIDGFAVCRKIKSDPLTRDINVIAVTGYPSEENIERIKKEGASFCLEKPLDFNELLDSLKKLIQTH